MNKIAQIFASLDYGPAPEGPDQAIAWLDSHDRTFGHFIDGAWTAPGKTFATNNPANGTELAQISAGTPADVDAAVTAARAAFGPWSALSGYERAKYLYAIARAVQKHSRLFAVLETLDNGKPIRESRDIDIPLVARHFYHHAGWAQHATREFPDAVPYGVCGQIIPWNFPLLMLAWKIAPALAAGNTVILKPAEFTSLTALLFAEICERIGLPKGVVNIVTGEGETGQAIVSHPGIDKIAFTGSTEVGKAIRIATAGTGKGLSLELGGKSPYIVFEDADIDSAIEGLVDAIWFNQGQVCCAGSRLLVQESIETRFIAKLKTRMASLRLGDPMDKSIDIGAMVAPVQVERIKDLMARGAAEGAVIYEPDNMTLPSAGCFLKPALVTNVSPANTLVAEEIFGPVLVAMSFRTPEEAVALANNTKYGLAATVWSENINLALDIAPKLKAGVVWINGTNNFDAAVGFGGYKESGFGREGGREGMGAYLKPKWEKELKPTPVSAAVEPSPRATNPLDAPLDQTAKMYIGGKQSRPDSAYNRPVLDPSGTTIGEVGDGNRKDIRNAVEAARAALGWSTTAAHTRSQILYYLAENLDYRRDEFAARILAQTGEDGAGEVALSVERLFAFAGWADKYDGAVHNPPLRAVAAAMVEPLGVMGIVAPPSRPLLGSIALIAPALAMGNTVVLVPSARSPLSVTDLYQVIETSDVPNGVINIVTGDSVTLAKTLAEHDGVDGLWFAGGAQASAMVEQASAGNLKQTWTSRGLYYDLADRRFEGDYFLAKATQIKNVWIPYGGVMTFLPQEIIIAKRNGEQLSPEAIAAFIAGFANGSVSHAQAAAFAMAVYFRDMIMPERVALTLAMRDSGTVLDWSDLDGPVADKHSTGGVGDNVSLMLAPILAAIGIYVPMISGRGLGHTGGTLDKFDAIPGYQTSPYNALFRHVVKSAGCAIIGQTADLAPADKTLYAIRDVTGTVESIPLITASILSKKLAAGLGALILDVKTGSGAFMPTLEKSRDLAQSLVAVANGAGLKTVALITDMNEPLASAAGNGLEIRNAVDFLTGKHQDARLREVTLSLCAELAGMTGIAGDSVSAQKLVENALDSGAATERFSRMVAGLGGPADFVEAMDTHLAPAPIIRDVFADRQGTIAEIDTRGVGMAVVALGGGRATPTDTIDHTVGFDRLAGLGAMLDAHTPIARIHARDEASAADAEQRLKSAYRLGDTAPHHELIPARLAPSE